MNDLTLVIPAKNESESLPKVLEELKEYNLKKIVVVPNDDQDTKDAIKNFDCKILDQKGNGFGSALIEGINTVDTKFFCIFNADGSFDPKYLSELKNQVYQDKTLFLLTIRKRSEDDTIITYIGNKFLRFL